MPLNSHFEPKKNAVFVRYIFRQTTQGTNESSINFATRLCKLATCEFADQNTEIQYQFINKCLFNCVHRHLLQEPNLALEKVVGNAQAMELVEKQSIIMQSEEMQAGIARLKV